MAEVYCESLRAGSAVGRAVIRWQQPGKVGAAAARLKTGGRSCGPLHGPAPPPHQTMPPVAPPTQAMLPCCCAARVQRYAVPFRRALPQLLRTHYAAATMALQNTPAEMSRDFEKAADLYLGGLFEKINSALRPAAQVRSLIVLESTRLPGG